MIQPYLKSFENKGEYKFIFIDGACTHCVNALSDDLYKANEKLRPEGYKAAEEVLEKAKELIHETPLFARVDMVRADPPADSRLLLVEFEVIEPYLYPDDFCDDPEQKIGGALCSGLFDRIAIAE